jgi:hypothetical protein
MSRRDASAVEEREEEEDVRGGWGEAVDSKWEVEVGW